MIRFGSGPAIALSRRRDFSNVLRPSRPLNCFAGRLLVLETIQSSRVIGKLVRVVPFSNDYSDALGGPLFTRWHFRLERGFVGHFLLRGIHLRRDTHQKSIKTKEAFITANRSFYLLNSPPFGQRSRSCLDKIQLQKPKNWPLRSFLPRMQFFSTLDRRAKEVKNCQLHE